MGKKERANINVSTLNKVKDFLKKQTEPIFKSDIVKGAGVDYNSVGLAITMLKIRTNKDGRIKLK